MKITIHGVALPNAQDCPACHRPLTWYSEANTGMGGGVTVSMCWHCTALLVYENGKLARLPKEVYDELTEEAKQLLQRVRKGIMEEKARRQ